MSPITLRLKVGVVFMVVLFARIQSLTIRSSPCQARENREFDFWVGDWDAFDVDSSTIRVARARVDLILDGCVLREDYEGSNGLKGQSLTIYDTRRRVWHQSWVTNRGQLLIIEGNIHAGEMVLSGVDEAMDVRTLVRDTWKPARGGVHETAVTSTDEGKTWKPWFDPLFRPHKP